MDNLKEIRKILFINSHEGLDSFNKKDFLDSDVTKVDWNSVKKLEGTAKEDRDNYVSNEIVDMFMLINKRSVSLSYE
jgi:hypothetical protein